MRRSEDARARSRPSLLGRGRAGCGPAPARHRRIPPFCVTGPTHSPATGTGAGPANGLPNSVPGFSDRCNCNEKSVMTAYTPLLFRCIPPAPSELLSGRPRAARLRRTSTFERGAGGGT